MGIFQSLNEITVTWLISDHRTHIERFSRSTKTVLNVDGNVSVRFYVKCCFSEAYLAFFVVAVFVVVFA